MSNTKNQFDIKCNIVRIEGIRKISDNLSIQTIVVGVGDGNRVHSIAAEFYNGTIYSLPDNLKPGDTIDLTFKLSGQDRPKKGGAEGELMNFTRIEGLNISKYK